MLCHVMLCHATKGKLPEGGRFKQTKIKLKCPPVLPQFPAQTLCKFSYFINLELTLGIKFIFIISLMHLFWKVRFVKKQQHLNLKKYLNVSKTKRVHAKQVLAQAHIHADIHTIHWHCNMNASSAQACEKACPKRKS